MDGWIYVCSYSICIFLCLSFRALRGSFAPDFGQDEVKQLYLMARYDSAVMREGVGR